MKFPLRAISSVGISLLTYAFAVCNAASAASSSQKPPRTAVVVPAAEVGVGNISVSTVKGKKPKKYTVSCYRGVSGSIRSTKKGTVFTPYSALISKLTKAKANTKTLALNKAKRKAGDKECKRLLSSPPPPPIAATPDFLSLDPYTGPFGEEEARLLYEHFAFAGTPSEIARAVQIGLGPVVNEMTSPIDEPTVDAIEADLQCDARLASDKDNKICDPTDPNAVNLTGFRYGLYSRMLNSQRPFFEKMWLFLHDERLAVSTRVLDSSQYHALNPYVMLIRKAARTGDYAQYMRDWNRDQFGHLVWLDGKSNRSTGPNENYAREFWELGTVGPTNIDGSPVYTDYDIAQSALAFTGWTVQSYTVNNKSVSYASYVPQLHAPGVYTIFGGTPYQAQVQNDLEVLDATFRHPRTAESLAEDIWKEFINPYPSPDSIRQLAAIIRAHGFNLLPTLRHVMVSKAMFARESRKSLIKQPLEKLIGFLRVSGIPTSFGDIDSYLNQLGQRPLLPDTVFGWDEKKLAGDAYILAWRNSLLSLTSSQTVTVWREKYGYDFNAKFLTGIPSSADAGRLAAERIGSMFNVTLNQQQKDRISQFMDFNLRRCYDTKQCNGQQYILDRSVFDPHPLSNNWDVKLRSLLSTIGMLPEYGLK